MEAAGLAPEPRPAFGRYTLLRRVGSGGMAEIWKASADGPRGFQKVLAIKRVLPAMAEDDDFVRMFVEEAKLAATLVHPNVVHVFDFGEIGGEFFLAMEYVAGTNLAQLSRRLERHGERLAPELVLALGVEACRGLACAHAKRIVHRDVSPQNLLVSYTGELKVTDFGIAKAAAAAPRTAAGFLRGKIAYMSPEQAQTAPLDGRSDLFSLGVVLYELLTGTRLFGRGASEEVYRRVLSFRGLEPEHLSAVHPPARDVLARTLACRREDRFEDASEMEAALARCAGLDALLGARARLAAIVGGAFEREMRLEALGDLEDGVPTVRSFPAVEATLRLAPRPRPSPSGALWIAAGVVSLLLAVILLAHGGAPREDPAPEAAPSPAPSRVEPRLLPAPSRPPRATATLRVSADRGTIASIDARRIEIGTDVPAAAGRRTLRIEHAATGYDAERVIEVEPGTRVIEVSFDAASRALRVELRE